MKRMRLLALPWMLISVLMVFLLSTAGVNAHSALHANASQANACGVWSVVSSPNGSKSGDTNLAAVAAITPSDAWAVGDTDPSISGIPATLAENWNGSKWSMVSTPNVGSFGNELLGVAAVSASDVWAVGAYVNNNQISQTLIEQWNGTSWSVVSSPNVGSSYNILTGAAAISANDVWAVGYSRATLDGAFSTLTEHWNGTQWSVVSSQNPGLSSNLLYSVKAVSTGDVFAVGQATNNSGPDQPLVENWNGSSWSVVSTPTASNSSTFYGVAATANNTWAVGQSLAPQTPGTQNFAQQTVNNKWTTVSIPSVGTTDNTLYGATAISDSNVWAVGTNVDATTGNNDAVIEQWNGTSWNVVSSPQQGKVNNILAGVSGTSANDVWAVGGYDNGTGTLSLVEHFC